MNRTIFNNMEVTVEQLVHHSQESELNSCSVRIKPRSRKVQITPLKRTNYAHNTKVFEKGRVKVMTRKDGTYMLTFAVHAQEDWAQADECLGVIRRALDATHCYDNEKKGGEE